MARFSTIAFVTAAMIAFLAGSLFGGILSNQIMVPKLSSIDENPSLLTWKETTSQQIEVAANFSNRSLFLLQREETEKTIKPSGYFAKQPVFLIEGRPPPSRVHCLSENFQEDSWMYRSCRFDNLCFDLDTKTFVLHPSENHQKIRSHVNSEIYLSTFPKEMISGGQHTGWLKKGRGKWMPESRNATNVTSYYMLSNDTVWISFYPWAACNTGHLMWDSFLPVYTLLDIFQLLDKKLFLTEMPNENGDCPSSMKEFSPAMGVIDGDVKVITKLELEGAQTSLVCSKYSASGMGWLTDHGLNLHGSKGSDFFKPRNVGRAPNFLGFRDYMLKHLYPTTKLSMRQPYKIIFSVLSSRDMDRRIMFSPEIRAVRNTFRDVQVKRVAMWNYTLREQVKMVSQSAIFITIGGGGSSAAFFLPRGACLIIYGKDGERFDWDLWNNYAQIRVHWLATTQRNESTNLLVNLIRDELDVIKDFDTDYV